jgi:S-adenosylmethionine hydrolase
MLQIEPRLTLVDLTHLIAPQDLWAARFHLMNAVPYFPQGTVHLAVVDPGVGTARRSIALAFAQGWLVGPDNGIFSGVLDRFPPQRAVALTNRGYWRVQDPSTTFHGRDIFAPAAAHLAQGVDLENLGEKIPLETLVRISLPAYHRHENQIVGCVQHIDRFGNLITNIPSTALPSPDQPWWVELKSDINRVTIPSALAYGAVPQGQLLALVGSHGWVEIAVNGGNAQAMLNVSRGSTWVLSIIFDD